MLNCLHVLHVRSLLGAILACLVVSSNSVAEPTADVLPSYKIEIVYIFDSDKPETILLIGNQGFRTVASLKKYVETFPAGTKLEISPGCKRIGGEPLINSKDEMDDFEQFCKKRSINFVVHPAG